MQLSKNNYIMALFYVIFHSGRTIIFPFHDFLCRAVNLWVHGSVPCRGILGLTRGCWYTTAIEVLWCAKKISSAIMEM